MSQMARKAVVVPGPGDPTQMSERLILTNPDGSPFTGGGGGGAGASVLSGMFSSYPDFEVNNDGTPVVLPIRLIDVSTGFEVSEGDTEIAASSGVYMVRLNVNWAFGTPPTAGWASVQMLFITDTDEIPLCSIAVNAEHVSSGFGDFSFEWDGDPAKTDTKYVPVDGAISVKVSNSADQDMNATVMAVIAKL